MYDKDLLWQDATGQESRSGQVLLPVILFVSMDRVSSFVYNELSFLSLSYGAGDVRSQVNR